MKKIAIVLGEPKSINVEIIAKSWFNLSANFKKKIFLIGSYDLLKKQLKNLNLSLKIDKITSLQNWQNNKKLKILDVPLKYKNLSKIKKKK